MSHKGPCVAGGSHVSYMRPFLPFAGVAPQARLMAQLLALPGTRAGACPSSTACTLRSAHDTKPTPP
eukprot:356015-Chlamydomonas_euryale.AAC.4